MVATNSPQKPAEVESNEGFVVGRDPQWLTNKLDDMVKAAKPQLRYLPNFEPLGKIHDQVYQGCVNSWLGWGGAPEQADAEYGDGLDDSVRCAVLAEISAEDLPPEEVLGGWDRVTRVTEVLMITQQGQFVIRLMHYNRETGGRGGRQLPHLRQHSFFLANKTVLRGKLNPKAGQKAVDGLRALVYKSTVEREKRLETMKSLRTTLAQMVALPDPYAPEPDPALRAGVDASGLRPGE